MEETFFFHKNGSALSLKEKREVTTKQLLLSVMGKRKRRVWKKSREKWNGTGSFQMGWDCGLVRACATTVYGIRYGTVRYCQAV